MLFFDNEASEPLGSMKQKLLGSKQGIGPKDKKWSVMWVPENAPAKMRDIKEK